MYASLSIAACQDPWGKFMNSGPLASWHEPLSGGVSRSMRQVLDRIGSVLMCTEECPCYFWCTDVYWCVPRSECLRAMNSRALICASLSHWGMYSDVWTYSHHIFWRVLCARMRPPRISFGFVELGVHCCVPLCAWECCLWMKCWLSLFLFS